MATARQRRRPEWQHTLPAWRRVVGAKLRHAEFGAKHLHDANDDDNGSGGSGDRESDSL